MEGIAASIAAGRFSFAFLDEYWYQRFPPLSPRTLADVARETGIAAEPLSRALEAFGYGGHQPGEALREDELETLRLVAMSLSAKILDEGGAVRFGRAVSESLRRIAQSETEIYHNGVEMPLLRTDRSQQETLELASKTSDLYTDPLERVISAAHRRQQELATIAHLIEHIESALEESGLYERPKRPAAMSFLDLEGYARLTEEQGDQEAARLADTLAGLVERRARERRGQAVKWLGMA